MAIDADLEELAALVADPGFKQKQLDFFTRHCGEFGPEEENRLAYTSIHQAYELQVESEITARLGEERVRRLMSGLEAYVAEKADFPKSERVAEAIDVLASLGDFGAFKQAMLARRAELAAAAAEGGHLRMGEVRAILTVEELVERVGQLREAADAREGWQEVVSTAEMAAYVRQCEGSSGTYCRMTLKLPLRPAECLDMFMNVGQESLAWRTSMRSLQVLKDVGPEDKVVEMAARVPWAVRYLLSMSDRYVVRFVWRRDWPQKGEHAYVTAPFDLERNIVLEESGVFGIKSGVISPDPSDPNRCVLTTLDLAHLGMMPKWGLSFILRKWAISSIHDMVGLYKKSPSYQQLQAGPES